MPSSPAKSTELSPSKSRLVFPCLCLLLLRAGCVMLPDLREPCGLLFAAGRGCPLVEQTAERICQLGGEHSLSLRAGGKSSLHPWT